MALRLAAVQYVDLPIPLRSKFMTKSWIGKASEPSRLAAIASAFSNRNRNRFFCLCASYQPLILFQILSNVNPAMYFIFWSDSDYLTDGSYKTRGLR